MRLSFRLQFISVFCAFIIPQISLGQSISVGTPALEDYYRRAQLLGKIDASSSFTSRPFYPANVSKTENIFDPDSNLINNRWTRWDGTVHFAKDKGFIQILPVTILTKYSRPIPFSMNDGMMIPARGFQPLISAGVYAKLGPLSIQFQPEYLYAQNLPYAGFSQNMDNTRWEAYYAIYNYIDLPEQFGEGPYKKASWGQSSIRLTFGPVSFGVSNENLWWGPGMRNSLLMTNSAPGFMHLTLNTVRPIKTPIGSFEGQLVGGRLDNSGFTPPIYQHDGLGNQWYIPKPTDWRYFNGIVLSYQPNWVPGLFIGATRSFTVYHEDLDNRLSSYLPVIVPLTEKNTDINTENIGRDQLASLFARWIWPKVNLEAYFEYGREDRSADLRDLFLDPTHTRAYLFGFSKMYAIKKHPGQSIQVNMEYTHLESVKSRRVGGVSSWYTHFQITQGYTNVGQLLGAGIGPGGNLQSISVSWVKGLKVVGLQMERFSHNNDYFYNAWLDTRSRWIDVITSLNGSWDYKSFVFTLKLDGILSMNYQFEYDPPVGTTDYWAQGKDIFSVQALLGIMYRF